MPKNLSHTRQQSESPQHRPPQTARPWIYRQVTAHDSTARSHIQAHDVKSKTLNRKGSRNGRAEQPLAPNDLGGVGETSPHKSWSKVRDDATEPEPNHVQSTTRESSAYGDPDPRPQSQSYTVNKSSKKSSSKEGEDTDDTGSRLAELVYGETAASSDSGSSDK